MAKVKLKYKKTKYKIFKAELFYYFQAHKACKLKNIVLSRFRRVNYFNKWIRILCPSPIQLVK